MVRQAHHERILVLPPLILSLSKDEPSDRGESGQPRQPSFRRKSESRKSPGKGRAGYRGFWIPAKAGTTVKCQHNLGQCDITDTDLFICIGVWFVNYKWLKLLPTFFTSHINV